MQFAIRIVITSLGYFVLSISIKFANANGLVSGWWTFLSYGCQGIGELLVNAIGTAMIAELVPKRIMGIMMGAWFITSATGSVLAGKLANLTAMSASKENVLSSLHIYGHSFAVYVWICFGFGILAFVCVPLIRYLTHIKIAYDDFDHMEI